MTPYSHTYTIEDNEVDCFGNLQPSMILFYAQDIAGRHCVDLQVDYDTMAARRLFWAVIRHRVQVSRMPRQGERITVQTWPMPTTRVAYPRATVAYDEAGKELFRIISLWIINRFHSNNLSKFVRRHNLISGELISNICQFSNRY